MQLQLCLYTLHGANQSVDVVDPVTRRSQVSFECKTVGVTGFGGLVRLQDRKRLYTGNDYIFNPKLQFEKKKINYNND